MCKSLGKFSTSYFCFNLIMVSKKRQHFIIPAQTDNSVLVRTQSRGTEEHNQISGMTVVARWPVEHPNEPIITQKEVAAEGQAAVGEQFSPKKSLNSGAASQPLNCALTGCQHRPLPSRSSINLSHGVPQSWSCVHVSCQLAATRGKQKVKCTAG